MAADVISGVAGAVAGAMAAAGFGYVVTLANERRQQKARVRAAETNARESTLREFWFPLQSQLEASRSSFLAQCEIRDRLIRLLMARGVVIESGLKADGYEKSLATAYKAGLADEERALHGFIRAITYGPILDADRRVLALLAERPEQQDVLARLRDLREHLQLWVAKSASHAGDPEYCIIYVGAEDGWPFPHDIDHSVAAKIEELRNAIGPSAPAENSSAS